MRALKQGKTCWNSLSLLLRHTDTLWMCLGSSQTTGGTYTSTDDPRFERITESMRWFKGWHDRVMSQPLTDRLSMEGRSMQFISYQCWCVGFGALVLSRSKLRSGFV